MIGLAWVSPQSGPLPPKEVLDYFKSKGMKPAFSYADVWREEHTVAFTVAGVMEKDLLVDLHKAVDEALREGLPFAEFRKKTTAVLADNGWLGRKTVIDPITKEEKEVDLGQPRRLKTIFDTNVRTARAAGQWARITRAAKYMPYLEYSLGPSRIHRPEHEMFDGLILQVDDKFWRTHMPPNGYGCRCRTRQLSETEAHRRGIGKSPELPMRTWENPRTGRQMQVPYGCDPGFDFNPGLERFGGLK